MIRLETVSYSFGAVQALEKISLTIKKGESVAVVGPSGCGKTTLLKMIGGLLTPEEGSITYDRTAKRTMPLSFVFQRPALLPWKTVRENVELAQELRKEENGTMKVLSLVGLAEFAHAYPYELSGGMQQRTALARALAVHPELLLLDEPFASLDELTREHLNKELRLIIKKLRLTTILITHAIREAVFLANRIIVLSERPGRIIKECEIKKRMTPTERERLVACVRQSLG